MSSEYLYGIHEFDMAWASLFASVGKTGWTTTTHALGSDARDVTGFDFRPIVAAGITPIARLNNGYAPGGTIPQPHEYDAFAQRCANFVAASRGCTLWIIGNEPNLSIERPAGVPITAAWYAACFAKCRAMIKGVDPAAQVLLAPVGPWNVETGDWITYWEEMQRNVLRLGGCDGLAIHAYTRTDKPRDIVSDAKMDAPYEHRYAGFRTYRDTMGAIIMEFRGLPVYMTEANPMPGWTDANTGVVQAIYAEINRWNQTPGNQTIRAVTLYRWPNHDRWFIEGKPGVLDDLRAAMLNDYRWQPDKTTLPGSLNTPVVEPPREQDAASLARGVKIMAAQVQAGQGYWRARRVRWLDTPEALAYGPDHHILGETLRDGKRVPFLRLRVNWPDGATRVESKVNPGYRFNYDYAMSASLNEFSIRVDDGAPSDVVSGIGMGKDGNSHEHTSTLVDWEWTIAGQRVVEPPPPVLGVVPTLIHPIADPAQRLVSQIFGVNGAYYARWSVDGVPLKGHTGVDFAVPEGTGVRAIAEGLVVEAAIDTSGYGAYIKLSHPWGESLYAHLSRRFSAVGDTVKAGDIIGWSGNSGISSGPHLHFGLRVIPFARNDGWGGFRDPLPYLTPGSGAVEPIDTGTPGVLDPLVVAAIVFVESNSTAFGLDGRMTIRFEPHIFQESVPADVFQAHFQVGTPVWDGEQHRYLNAETDEWQAIHASQAQEYGALAVARAISESAALEATAMGLGQVMGFNARRVGFASVSQMFNALRANVAAQLMAVVNFLQSDAQLAQAVADKNFLEVAKRYNGDSPQAAEYARRMEVAYQKLKG